MKKLLIGIVILVVLFGAAGAYWRWLQPDKNDSDPLDAIPTSAAIVVCYPNLSESHLSFRNQDYYRLLSSVDGFQEFFWLYTMADSLLRTDAELSVMFQGSAIWTSFHQSGSDTLQFFTAIRSQKYNDQRALDNIKKAFTESGSMTEQQLGAVKVLRFVKEKPASEIYFASHKGLVMAASELKLIATAMEQMSSGASLKKEPEFVRMVKAAGQNVAANIFIQFEELPRYLQKLAKPSVVNSEKTIGRFASWMELDVNLTGEGVKFNGFTTVGDSLRDYLGLFISQQPQPIVFPDILPANTASFMFFGIDIALTFSSDYRKYLNKLGKLQLTEEKLDTLNAFYETDLEQNLLSWMGNSFGICITQPKSQSFSSETFAIFSSTSEELAGKLLDDLSAQLSAKNEVKIEELTVNGILIRQLPLNGLLSELLGSGLDEFKNPSYMLINNHVIFGKDNQSLSIFLQSVQADKTLAKDLAYTRFSEYLGSTFNVFIYSNYARSKNIVGSYVNDDALNFLSSNSALTDQFNTFGMQLTSSGESFYTNAFLLYENEPAYTQTTTWECLLDSKAQIAPVWVKNHLNGEPEVLVQDELNQVYLFNKAGQQLFKTKIEEPIESRPIQVDAFKNGKLQYLFNTKNFIHLMDRDGNSVAGFPLKLNAPATTKLAVFDYEKDHDYRLMISCENKKIYNYDIKGKLVSGWNHTSSSDLTIHPFTYLVDEGKDYLVTGESGGKIHLLDRRGKNRVAVAKKLVTSKNNHLFPFHSTESAFTGIYTTDEHGIMYRIDLNGAISPMELSRFSPEHHFAVSDLNKDGGPEFIFSDLNMLQVFNYKKQKIFEHRLDPSASAPFLVELGDAGIGIGFCMQDAEELWLFDTAGQMVSGFPLSGTSPFELLTVGSEKLVVSAHHGTSVVIQSVQ